MYVIWDISTLIVEMEATCKLLFSVPTGPQKTVISITVSSKCSNK